MRKTIKYSFNKQFHILRHFSKIDDDYRSELKTNTNFTEEEINNQLSISGSKFYHEFASNPIQLWNKIQSHEEFNFQYINLWKKNRAEILLFFNQDDYPNGIANNALVKVDDLPAEKKALLKQQDRDGFIVKHLSFDTPMPSWQLNIILINEKEPGVITIFPGIYAPPLPNPKLMQSAELEKSKLFWEQYAFVD